MYIECTKALNILLKRTLFVSRQVIFKYVTLAVISFVPIINIAQVSEASNPAISMQINVDDVKANVSPMLYGLMTEEINFCYEGGLYGELIRNRLFNETPRRPRGRRGQDPQPEPEQPSGNLIQMKASGLEEVNTIDNPKNIVPITTELNGVSKDFTQTFPAYSISILKMYGK